MSKNPRAFSDRANRGLSRIYWAAAALFSILICAAAMFINALRNENGVAVLDELNSYALTAQRSIQNQLIGDFQTLDGVAYCFPHMQESMDANDLRQLLTEINLSNTFIRMGRAGLDGRVVMLDVDGSGVPMNFAKEPFFQDALAGNKSIQKPYFDAAARKRFIRYAVPIKNHGNVVGVLIGSHDADRLFDVVNISLFNNHGYSNITDSNGDLIIRNNSAASISYAKSLFDLGTMPDEQREKLICSMEDGESGRYTYKTPAGRTVTAIYLPLGFNGWYIHCALSDQYVTGVFRSASTGMLLSLLISVAVFFGLTAIFVNILRRDQQDTRLQATRFRMLQNTSKDAIFEYSVQKDLFSISTFTGSGEAMQKEIPNFLRGGMCRYHVQSDYCHACLAVAERLLAAPVSENIDLPILKASGQYTWCRISCQSVAGSRGRVTHFFGSMVNIDELVRARDAAQKEAAIDTLTGALTRKAFLSQARMNYEEHKDQLSALVMLDLDNFKEINDLYGHMEGDRLLSMLVSLLNKVFAADDLIGRYGGDEFFVFMQNVSTEVVEKRLSQFIKLFSQEQAHTVFKATCSIGVVFSTPEQLSFDQLIWHADVAMYQAKNVGKNRYVMLDADTINSSSDSDQDVPKTALQLNHTIQPRTLLEYMDAGLVLVEVDTVIRMIYASNTYFVMNDRDPSDYPLPCVLDLDMVYHEDVPRLEKALLECAASGEPAECIYRVYAEGKAWRQMRAVRIPYAGNQVPTLLAVVMDITSVRQSQEFALQYEYDLTINKTMSELYDEVFEIDYISKTVTTRFSKFAKKRMLGIQLPMSSTTSRERWFAENRPLKDEDADRLHDILFASSTSIEKPIQTLEYQRRIPNGEVLLIQATLLQVSMTHSLLCTVNKAKLKSNKL